jgi:hypothetical protein
MNEVAVYDGRVLVGIIARTPSGYSAKDATGRTIGVFITSAEATRAIFAARDGLPKRKRCSATP